MGSYPSAEVQSVYSTAPADWAILFRNSLLYIYIYIYIERERERDVCVYMCVYVGGICCETAAVLGNRHDDLCSNSVFKLFSANTLGKAMN